MERNLGARNLKHGSQSRLANPQSAEEGRRFASAANRQAPLNSFIAPPIDDQGLTGGISLHHFEATFTVTLLFARFESSCGEAVCTVAVLAISWAGPEAATVSVIVA